MKRVRPEDHDNVFGQRHFQPPVLAPAPVNLPPNFEQLQDARGLTQFQAAQMPATPGFQWVVYVIESQVLPQKRELLTIVYYVSLNQASEPHEDNVWLKFHFVQPNLMSCQTQCLGKNVFGAEIQLFSKQLGPFGAHLPQFTLPTAMSG